MDFVKLIFKPKANAIKESGKDKDACELHIYIYLSTLRDNGQIFEDYHVVEVDDRIEVFIAQTDIDSLEEKYNSKETAKNKENLDLLYDVSREIIGKNNLLDKVCDCENPSHYVFITAFDRDRSPITCGDCGCHIPLYRLPFTEGQEHHGAVAYWEGAYKNIDSLWFMGLADRWTGRQMADPKSALSKIGREYSADLEKASGKKVYYYINANVNRFKFGMSDKQPDKSCPLCRNSWREEKPEDSETNLFCDNCRLVTTKFWED